MYNKTGRIFESRKVTDMATIKDIADEVGISKAAVSRILNHKGSFSQETIRNVERVARRMNYTSMNMLRQEVEKEERRIRLAVVLPSSMVPYFGMLASMIEQAAYEYQYEVVLYSSMFAHKSETVFFQELKERNISGILMATFVSGEEVILGQDIPVVTVGFQISEAIPSIRSDYYSGGCLAARHLIGKGCKKLLYVSRSMESLNYDERYRGFLDEAKRKDCQVWAYHIEANVDLQDVVGMITGMSLEHSDADGIFSESFRLGNRIYKTFSELGYKIPEDIRIISYGNPFLSSYCNLDITMIMENTRQIVSRAVSVIADMIESVESAEEKKLPDILVPVSLKTGGTT